MTQMTSGNFQKSLACRCDDCDQPFKMHFDAPLPASVAIMRLLNGSCPMCNSDKIMLGLNLGLSEDRAMRRGVTLDQRIADWINNGDVGLAARSIVDYMTLGEAPEHAPTDYDSLRRVALLIDRIPEWADRMTELAAFSNWNKIARDWKNLIQTITSLDAEMRDPPELKMALQSVLA